MSALKAYPGSCHCGNVKYQIKLKFPPDMTSTRGGETVRLYKCNCTTCQKMGLFHCRPIDPAEDFILLSPDSIEKLGDYRTSSKKQGWYFCKLCGVRIVGLGGDWEQVSLDVEHWAGVKPEPDEEKIQRVWKTKGKTITTKIDDKDVTKPFHYLSVNAVTLEPSEDIDLKRWHDERWIFYVENLVHENGTKLRVSEPFPGGMY